MITPRAHVASDGTITWRVPFRLDGHMTSETFGTQREAEAFARLIAQLGAAAARGVLDERADVENVPTVAEWAEHHIAHISGAEPGTLRTYRAYARRDLGALARLPLTAVNADAIARWVNVMAAHGSSGKTIKNKHGFVAAMFTRAVRDGIVPANPCQGTSLPKTAREPMTCLTHTEYAIFLGYIQAYWVPLTTTLFSTGMRWSEVTALRVSDVDLEGASITITQAWKAGVGRRLGPPKSAMSRRTIALAPETVDLLRPIMAGRSGRAFLFVNTQGGPVRAQTFHANVWLPAVRLANGEPARAPGKKSSRVTKRRVGASGAIITPATVALGKRPRIHDARHTCASWLLASGIPITYVQAHLGHENITTTVKTYGHLLPGAKNAVAAALSHALTQAHPAIEPDAPKEIEA